MAKIIPLTQGKYVIVDDEDYVWLREMKWHVRVIKEDRYLYANHSKRNKKTGKVEHTSMHRMIMGVTDSDIYVDHIDGNTLNNQKSNLRLATNTENIRNQHARHGGTSKYKGVYKAGKDTWKKPWKAVISYNNKKIQCGWYEKDWQAALAYDLKAHELYGEFANFNLIKEIKMI